MGRIYSANLGYNTAFNDLPGSFTDTAVVAWTAEYTTVVRHIDAILPGYSWYTTERGGFEWIQSSVVLQISDGNNIALLESDIVPFSPGPFGKSWDGRIVLAPFTQINVIYDRRNNVSEIGLFPQDAACNVSGYLLTP